MNLTAFKLFIALTILIATILGGIWPFLKKQRQQTTQELDFPIGESLASGIFFGAGLLHMLPDAVTDFSAADYHYPWPFLIAALSFLLLLLLEHISVTLQHHAHQVLSSIALLTLTMLSIHSLLEGAAVGVSNTFAETIIIFIAIIAHKSAASFALATHLTRSKLNTYSALLAFCFFALMTPIGIFVGDNVLHTTEAHSLLAPIFSSLAAGTFLYIGTLHGLGRASLIRHCCNMREFIFMTLGFSLMAIVGIWT